MLNIAFDPCPDIIDPVLSRTNHEISPTSIAFLVGSGAMSYTHSEMNQRVTAHPRRIPANIAQTNFRSGELNVKLPSSGQLRTSKQNLAPYV